MRRVDLLLLASPLLLRAWLQALAQALSFVALLFLYLLQAWDFSVRLWGF